MVVLVVLALINLGLVYRLYQELKTSEQHFMEEITGIESYLVNHDAAIREQIKKIPKEIAIKNYLKIP